MLTDERHDFQTDSQIHQLPNEILEKCIGAMEQPRPGKVCHRWHTMVAKNRHLMKALHLQELTFTWSETNGKIYVDVLEKLPEFCMDINYIFRYAHLFYCTREELFDKVWYMFPESFTLRDFTKDAVGYLMDELPDWWLKAIVTFNNCDFDYSLVTNRLPSLNKISVKTLRKRYPEFRTLKNSDSTDADVVNVSSLVASMQAIKVLNVEVPSKMDENTVEEIIQKSQAEPSGLLELNLGNTRVSYQMALNLVKRCKFHPQRFICLEIAPNDIEEFLSSVSGLEWKQCEIHSEGISFTSGTQNCDSCAFYKL